MNGLCPAESASRTHIRRLLQGGGSTATSTAEAIAAALAAGDTQAAAAAIAKVWQQGRSMGVHPRNGHCAVIPSFA